MLNFGLIFSAMILAQVYVLMLEPRYLLDWLGPWIERLPDKLAKLLTCATCMAGQLSLWLYPVTTDDYSAHGHVLTVALTIWITHLSNRIFYE
jgi:hypothetical protein